jgi:hypothetical protein
MEIINEPNEKTNISAKEWALNIFLASLPIAGLILLLVWAFSDAKSFKEQQRSNWAKGKLILALIALAAVLIFFFVFGGLALIAGIASEA